MSTYRQFAERILFATSIEDKLHSPETLLVDDDRGQGILAPMSPSRPSHLFISQSGERGVRPREHQLNEERQRGLLLHFFCNHELLATELMALALLKFPDAPAEFRKGLLRTLQEEQVHTQWYLQRMAECGVSFGEYPVNGFFWRHIAGMETPLDYVARLSLTFEQANLDYAQHFSARFAEAGDAVTSELLGRIYQDEIAHVGYGLKWFRRWKGSDRSDWKAYQEMLPFPLSPARAKGTVMFNAIGRSKAGLDAEFISQLHLYSQSRGRPPWVYYFNPQAEAAAATNDPAATDFATRQLALDLDTLSIFLAKSEDMVLLQRPVSEDFLRSLSDLGVEIPAQEILHKGRIKPESPLRQRKLGRLRPWGWSADSHELMQDVMPSVTAEPGVSPWNAMTRLLYSKSHAADCLRQLPWDAAFGDPWIIGGQTRTVEEIWRAGNSAVAKANFGIAGRSMARFAPGDDLSPLDALQAAPGGCIVEPWLERVADFSVQYEVDANQVPRLKGYVRLHCEPSGRFTACVASGTFTRLLPSEVAQFLQRQGSRWMKQLYKETLPEILRQRLAGSNFRGFLGIDAFFYRDANGAIKLKPLVEINPRCTMGRVTLELLRVAAPGRTVLFRIFSKQALRRAAIPDFAAAARNFTDRFPPALSEKGCLDSGCFPLNDPATAQGFLGMALVAHRAIGPADFQLKPSSTT